MIREPAKAGFALFSPMLQLRVPVSGTGFGLQCDHDHGAPGAGGDARAL